MSNPKTYQLTSANIDEASAAIESFLTGASIEKKNILRLKLMIEEILLNYRDHFGGNEHFTLLCAKRFSHPRVVISVAGESFEPFSGIESVDEDEYSSEVLRGMLSTMGLAPSYRYKNGRNVITLTPEKKKRVSSVIWLLVSVVLAVGAGLLCSLFPESTRTFLSDSIIAPISGTFLGLLSAVSGPLIFFSVLWGIYSVGDVASFGKIGKRMIARFLLISALLLVLFCFVLIPFFSVSSGGGDKADFSDLYQMLLNIIPSNLLTPFTEGNSLQIIFIAVIFGLSMLILNDKTATVAKFTEQANYIIQFIMKCLSGLIPIFVFFSIFNIIIGGNFDTVSGSVKPILLGVAGDVFVMIVYTVFVCLRRKVSPLLLIKKVLPTFMITLTTASSAAAYAINVEACEKRLGIDKKIISFGLPLGQVIFMPGMAALFFTMGLCMAEVFDVAVTPIWLVTLFVIAFVLAVAAPPVPGGALVCYTILMTQLGIPDDAVSIAIALNVILDFITTAANIFCLQLELTDLSGSLDMLDTEKLQSDC